MSVNPHVVVVRTRVLCVQTGNSGVPDREASLQSELEGERLKYQNLLKEFSRVEQRYENLKEEMSMSKVSDQN